MLKNNQKLKCKPEKLLKKNVPEKEVELCLEVEMDDEVKDIITCPGKYGSTLLDVTVIKPKDIDKLCTSHKKTMSSDEVRKFIASMNLEGNIKEKIHPTKERDHNETKSFGDYTKKTNTAEKQKRDCGHAFFDNVKKIYTTDDTASELFSNRHENHKVKQIYAAPKTFLDLNNMFECKKKKRRDHNEKLNSPCLCQNCAIVGLVTESQKKPFAMR
ncbi:hypothetical protein JTB14_038352 [Gonioctena quinquepunctata]|nr:hypothetical protein JTB14_038352 [Gonioctena quinquepunctata]